MGGVSFPPHSAGLVQIHEEGYAARLPSPNPQLLVIPQWLGSFRERGEILGDLISRAGSEDEWGTLTV